MLKNFLKITFRNLQKNKGYSFLNIAGLAIGIACAGLIFLWVEDEMHFNHNNVKRDNLYMVRVNAKLDVGVRTHSSTPNPLAPALNAEVPGIANTLRTTEHPKSVLFSIGDKSVYAEGLYAEPSIFNMFTLPFVQGNSKTAFNQLYSLVITEKTAKKFFGNDNNVVGKTIRVDNKQDYVIGGVVKDLPANSTFQFEWLAPFQIFDNLYDQHGKWGNFGLRTYVELKDGADRATVDKQLYDIVGVKQNDKNPTVHAFLFGMNDWRLYDDFENGKKTGSGRIQYVHLFSTIAWIILFIACINFMNLATARSERRAREVGVRKVLGSGKTSLAMQFIGEALVMAFLAAAIAVLIILIVLPFFNTLVQKQLSPGLGNPMHLVSLFVLTLLCGLVAGSYPSLYLSSFNPVFVLKGIKMKGGSAAWIRKSLVILQFTISIVLIIGTIIITQQIQHIKSRKLGFDKDNLIQMNVQGDMIKNFPSIRQDMINTGVAENVALTDHETITAGNNTTNTNWDGKDPSSLIVISQRNVSPEYISTVGMTLSQGRNFEAADIVEIGPDRKPKDFTKPLNVIVTESLEKIIGNGSALGKTLQRETDVGTLTLKIIGVVKDYVYGDMYGQAEPVVFYCVPEVASLVYLKVKSGSDPETALAKIGAVMKKDNPAYPFEYRFVDDQFNAMFLSEMLISKLSRVFAALAIIISCLGLFGLAAYTAERRIKEIGVRKVLGASVSGIAALLSVDFIKLVIVSCLLAFPVAWWMMHDWLQHYEYRISINWWVFLVASIIAIAIALVTISFQAIKAAIANPVKSLRSE